MVGAIGCSVCGRIVGWRATRIALGGGWKSFEIDMGKFILTGHLHLPPLYYTNVMGNTTYSTSEHGAINYKDIISIISTRYHGFREHHLGVLQRSTR
jgi:hypothetical protein